MRAPSTSTVFFVSGCCVIGSLSINGRAGMTMPRDCGERKRTGPHMGAAMPFAISDLRQCPEFFDIVADRIWQAWWKADGHPLDYISGRLRENMNATPIPFALVAHDGKSFLGTASVIASDLPERPQLTPWVAAVWVEAHARRGGGGGGRVTTAQRGG